MRIQNQQTPSPESPSRIKSVLLWALFAVVMLAIGIGSAAILTQRETPQGDAGEDPVEDAITEDEAPLTAQTEIEAAVEHALAEQAEKHQATVAELEGQLKQFEQDDVEGYQAQVADLQTEITALREANAELKEANDSLSQTNAELVERTTVAEIQEAYDAQIEELEADNQELEELLQSIQRQLEGGQ